jgi:hypothetical protein
MKGVIGATVVKTIYGTYKIQVECQDLETAEKVVKKLRIVGIFCQMKVGDSDGRVD